MPMTGERDTATARRSVTIGAHAVSYLEAGPDDAPAVVLLHGLASDCTTWDRAIAPLADYGCPWFPAPARPRPGPPPPARDRRRPSRPRRVGQAREHVPARRLRGDARAVPARH